MLWTFFYIVLAIIGVGTSGITTPCVHQITHPIGHTEGPHWDGRNNILYFVNIPAGEVYAYHYGSSLLKKIILNGNVSPVIPARKDPHLLLVGVNRSVVAIEWNGKHTLGDQQVLTTVSQKFPNSRFNDGKADKQGRLWWGTIGSEVNRVVVPDQAVFYTITKENLENPTVAAAPVTNSNGLAWNKANNKLYYIDTPTLKVVEFDYNDEKGIISSTNKTVFDIAKWANITGLPDGMTIDTEDNLYIALFGGGAVIKVNPTTGKLLKIIAIPAKDVTSAMWGGENLDILFVTTSNTNLTPIEKLESPAAGSVFAVTGLNAKGFPAHTADIIDEIPKKKNLIEVLFNPEILSSREPTKNQKIVQTRQEPGLWDSFLITVRNIFAQK
ncbi:regucalcin-like isoform X1 [Diorhabda sublineata]|uniref:regucalcin-like isoform X1 n=1 Tax=Diorhabda sublineata TaxID=1163346 RepID=UPI0024E043FA|nr:regucalcin-like isoform X1 [Diorhabda sublineata]